MPLIIGILLTPLSALIGTVLFFTVIALLPSMGWTSFHEYVGMIVFGMLPGLILSAPVTALALPLTFGILRRRSALNVLRLTLAGAGFGFICVLVLIFSIWWRDDGKIDGSFWMVMLGLALDGAVAGAVSGSLLAWLTRFVQPEAWHGSQPDPRG